MKVEEFDYSAWCAKFKEEPLPPLPDEAKLLFRKVFFNFVSNRGFKTEPNKAYTEVADWLAEWFAFSGGCFNNAYAPPKKGLLITGPTGTGKTVLAKMIKRFSEKHKLNFNYYPAREIVREVMIRGPKIFDWYKDEIKDKPLIIDDIGMEGNPVIYGVPHGIAEILEDRYDEMCHSMENNYYWLASYPAYTIVTTNLGSMEDISRRYGGRVSSRFNTMFKSILCDWPKDRRSENNARI